MLASSASIRRGWQFDQRGRVFNEESFIILSLFHLDVSNYFTIGSVPLNLGRRFVCPKPTRAAQRGESQERVERPNQSADIHRNTQRDRAACVERGSAEGRYANLDQSSAEPSAISCRDWEIAARVFS